MAPRTRRTPAKSLVRNERGGVTADQFDPAAPKWLCSPVGGPDRWPVGSLVYFVGEDGTAKSIVTMSLVAAVTNGSAWPHGGKTSTKPSNVLLLNGDDPRKEVLIPRLDAAGADRSRVHFLDDVLLHSGRKSGGELYLPGRNGEDLEYLISYIHDYQIKLCILDPASDFMRLTSGVRARVLGKLGTAAQTLGCTIVMVIHVPEYRADPSNTYRGAGGHEVPGACRSGFDVIVDQKYRKDRQDTDDRTERFILRHKKNSYGAKSKPLAYVSHEKEVVAGVPAQYVTFEQEEVTIEMLEKMLAFDAQLPPRTAHEAWLVAQLMDAGTNGIPRAELLVKAKAAGVPESTLDRLSKAMKVVKVQKGAQVDGRPTKIAVWYHPNFAPAL